MQLAAMNTPQRRSMAQLTEQLQELFEDYADNEQRGAPLKVLPRLIESFEGKRGITLLTQDEKDAVNSFAATSPDGLTVTIDDFISLLAMVTQAFTSHPGSEPSESGSSMLKPSNAIRQDGSPLPAPRRPGSRAGSLIPVKAQSNSRPASSTSAAPRIYLGCKLDIESDPSFDPAPVVSRLHKLLQQQPAELNELISIIVNTRWYDLRTIAQHFLREGQRSLVDTLNSKDIPSPVLELAQAKIEGPLQYDVRQTRRLLNEPRCDLSALAELLVSRPAGDLRLLIRSFDDSSPVKLRDALLTKFKDQPRSLAVWRIVLDRASQRGQHAAMATKSTKQDFDLLNEHLHKSGDAALIAEALLSKTPSQLRALVAEHNKTRGSLTAAIKLAFPSDVAVPLQHAVEQVKRAPEHPGSWRAAKLLSRSIAEQDANLAVTRLVRSTWTSDRFTNLRRSYRDKTGKDIHEDARDKFGESGMVSALARQICQMFEGRAASPGSDHDLAMLEGDGELSDPTSPLSPTPGSLASSQRESSTSIASLMDIDMDESDSFLSRTTTPSDLGSPSNSSADFTLNALDKSTTGSTRSDVPKRHSRPIAPGRLRRSLGDANKSARSDGGGELSELSRAISPASDSSRSRTPGLERSKSPLSPEALDTTSYHPMAGLTVPNDVDEENDLQTQSLPTTATKTRFPSLLSEEFDPSPGRINASISSPTVTGETDRTAAHMRRDRSAMSGHSASSSSSSSRPTSLFGEGSALEDVTYDTFFSSDSRHALVGLSSSEQIKVLLRQCDELQRRVKEKEARLETSVASFEDEISTLENKLDEARGELQLKKKEEKELRLSEKQHLAQISSLEADIARITTSLEKSRESYESMKRSYLDQCAETEKLRQTITSLRDEVRSHEVAADTHATQVDHFERDRALLQSTIERLESELQASRKANDVLEEHKQENLVLKETIDRMRFELDESRNAHRRGASETGTGAESPSKASLSKSLGAELARRLAADGNGDEDEGKSGSETEGEEEVNDIIVTTHRRVKRQKKRADQSATPPQVVHQTIATEVGDADVQTEAVQTREAHVQTHPRSRSDLQQDLAEAYGVDVEQVKECVRPLEVERGVKDVMRVWNTTPPRRGRWADRFGRPSIMSSSTNTTAKQPTRTTRLVEAVPESARPLLASLLESTTTFMVYTIVLYLGGIMTGSKIFGGAEHAMAADQLVTKAGGLPFNVLVGANDRALWQQYNAFGQSWAEGVYWHGYGGSTGTAGGIFQGAIVGWLNEWVALSFL